MNTWKTCITASRLVYQCQIRTCVVVNIDYRHKLFDKYVYMNKYYRDIRTYYLRQSSFVKNIQRCRLRNFCTAQSKDGCFASSKEVVRKEFRSYIEHNKERLRVTEQKIKHKGSVLLKDIKETKDKVREKVEEIVEVRFTEVVSGLIFKFLE